MISPARRHFLQATAAAQAAVVGADQVQTSDAYKLMMASLIEDRRRLSDIQSIELKIAAKRDMLPTYAPYLAGVLEGGTGAQDQVLVTLLVWHLDVGDIKGALPLAEYAIKHKLESAEQYQRSLPAILVEETADTLLRSGIKPEWKDGGITNSLAADEHYSEQIALLEGIDKLTESSDMHDPIRAKLYKATGYLHALRLNHAPALALLRRALALDNRCGVVKDIERLANKTAS